MPIIHKHPSILRKFTHRFTFFFYVLDFPSELVEEIQKFIKELFIQEQTGVRKTKHPSRHDLQWKFHILASCVDLLVWSAKDDTGTT